MFLQVSGCAGSGSPMSWVWLLGLDSLTASEVATITGFHADHLHFGMMRFPAVDYLFLNAILEHNAGYQNGIRPFHLTIHRFANVMQQTSYAG